MSKHLQGVLKSSYFSNVLYLVTVKAPHYSADEGGGDSHFQVAL